MWISQFHLQAANKAFMLEERWRLAPDLIPPKLSNQSAFIMGITIVDNIPLVD